MKQLSFVVCVWLACALVAVRAAGPDELYLDVYNLIEEADKLGDGGNTRLAITKYLETRVALKNLQTAYPDWNTKIVTYRLQYISARLDPLNRKLSGGPVTPPAPPSPGQALTNQLRAMEEDIRRLADQNALLEGRLREALTVQPAAADPRELARAETRIKNLQKERDLLATTLEQSKPKHPDPGVESEKEKAITELQQQLTSQRSVASLLEKQNEDLRKQLQDHADRLQQRRPVAAGPGSSLPFRETIAMLQASNRVLAVETAAMENRLLDWVRRQGNSTLDKEKEKEWERQLAAAQADAATARRERDELVQKLNAVTRQLNDLSGRAVPAPAATTASADLNASSRPSAPSSRSSKPGPFPTAPTSWPSSSNRRSK